jgi:NodT family efflux transporter outer membrane factor (OMF) lipoprotein
MLAHSATRRGTTVLLFVVAAVAVFGQSGCTTVSEFFHNGCKVGPNYESPPVPLPPQWIDQGHPHVVVGEANLAAWWDVFGDPVLSQLIQDAYAQNLTVRQAGIQIIQANIQRNVARAELLPQGQSLVAGYSHGVVSRNNGVSPAGGPAFSTGLTPGLGISPLSTASTPIAGATPTSIAGTTTTGASPLLNSSIGGGGAGGGVPAGTSRFFDNIGSSLNLSWELDFWGLFRRNLEAANANLDQSMHNYDELVVLLLANVATQYVEIRTFQRRLELARKNVALQEPLVAAYGKRYKTGIANAKPGYFQLLSNLENTKALIPSLEISLRQANNQLAILLGRPVEDLLPVLGDGKVPSPDDPKERVVRIPRSQSPEVVVGIPGEFLLRRPDVRAVEDQLRIQSAQIGIAEAEMLPHMGVNGSIGLAASRLNQLFNQQSWIASIGPSLTWNILNYGRLLANVRAQNYLYQQFVLAYQQAILNANQDAENAMIAYLGTLDQSDHLRASADAAFELTSYIIKQFESGFLPAGATDTSAFINQLFTAINFQVTQQDAAAQAEGNIALNLILLYRAMGGGWQIREMQGRDGCAQVRADGSRPPVLPPIPVEGAPKESLPPPVESLPKPKPLPPPDPAPKVEPKN